MGVWVRWVIELGQLTLCTSWQFLQLQVPLFALSCHVQVSRAQSLEHFNVGGTFITDVSLLAISEHCPLLKVRFSSPERLSIWSKLPSILQFNFLWLQMLASQFWIAHKFTLCSQVLIYSLWHWIYSRFANQFGFCFLEFVGHQKKPNLLKKSPNINCSKLLYLMCVAFTRRHVSSLDLTYVIPGGCVNCLCTITSLRCACAHLCVHLRISDQHLLVENSSQIAILYGIRSVQDLLFN